MKLLFIFFKSAQVLFILLFLLLNRGFAQNTGFEVTPGSTPPNNWTAVTGTWNTSTNPTQVRTGNQSMAIIDPATTGTTIGTTTGWLTTTSPQFLITIGWGLSNTASNALFHLGFRSGTTNTLNPTTTTSGQPANLNNVNWSRITSVSASTVAAGTYGVSLRAFRSASTAGTDIYIDDIIIYASSSNVPDLSNPSVAQNVTLNGATLSWVNGLDNGSPASGIGGVVILRADGANLTPPLLNDQAMYNTVTGALGSSIINSGPNTWTVIANINDAVTNSFIDLNQPSTPVTYAVYMRDIAYNYSTPVTATAATACNNPINPGNSFASSTFVCSGANVNLGLTGFTGGIGQTFQWQSASALGGPYINIGTPITSSGIIVNPTADTYYRCEMVCSAGTPAYSSPVLVQVNPGVSGTYTINSMVPTGGTNFQTFQDAVNAINACGLSGAAVFNVASVSGPYTGPITLGQLNTSLTNTLTFNCNNATLNFTGTASVRHGILLNGTNHVTFNDLNIVSQDPANGFGIVLTAGADNNNFNNINIDLTVADANTGTGNAGVVVSGSAITATTVGVSGSNNTFNGININGGYYGFSITGPASPNFATGNKVLNSSVLNSYFYGIYCVNQANSEINNNFISRPTRTTLSTFYGIYYATGGINNLIHRNTITNSNGAIPTNTSSVYPIFFTGVDATVGNENKIINNLIYNINNNALVYGINNSSSDNMQIYHNTISLDHPSVTAGNAYGIYQTTLATGIDIKNNIISVVRTGSGNKYAIYMNTATTTFTSNNNVLHVSSATGATGIGFLTSGYSTLAAWQAATNQDLASISVDPQFANASNGDFTPTNAAVNNIGAPLNITTDINNLPRSVSNPDPGAFEIGAPQCLAVTAANFNNITSTGALFNWTPVINVNNYQYVVSTVNTLPTGAGIAATGNSVQLNGLTASTLYYVFLRAECSINNFSTWRVDSFTTTCASAVALITPAGPTTFCQGGDVLLNASTGTNFTYQWNINGSPIPGATNASFLASAHASYTVLVSAGVGCDALSPVVQVTVNTFPPTSISLPTNTVCQGSSVVLQANIGANLSYQWNLNGQPIAGATATTYQATLAGDYTVTVTRFGCASTSAIQTINVTNPQIISVINDSICGPGAALLGAIANAGSAINWYFNASGGQPFQTSNALSLPNVVANATFYVSASNGGFNTTLGRTVANSTATSGAGTTNFGLVFDVLSPFTLNSVTIYPVSASNASGTVTIDVINASNQVLHTATFNVQGAPTSAPVPQVLNLNFNLQPGTNLKLRPGSFTGISGLLFEPSSAAPGGNYGYPFVVPNVVSINTSTLTAAPNNTPRNDLYYYFYNWNISTGCESSRHPVGAFILPLPIVDLGNDTAICQGASVALNAGSQNSYLWSNGSNNPSINVNSSGTVWVEVTNIEGCTASDTINVTVNALPQPILNDVNICQGETITLDPGIPATDNLFNWSTGATTSTIDVNSAGVYTVTVTNFFGCVGTDSAQINVNIPQVFTLSDTTVCIESSNYSVSLPSSYTNVVWSNGASGNILNISFNAPGETVYSYTAEDANGCEVTESFRLIVTVCGSINENEIIRFNVFPNPSNGKVRIQAALNENVQMIVFDLNGKEIFNTNLSNIQAGENVDLSQLAKGTYLATFSGKSVIKHFKLILQ
jgi:hypothetical protein